LITDARYSVRYEENLNENLAKGKEKKGFSDHYHQKRGDKGVSNV